MGCVGGYVTGGLIQIYLSAASVCVCVCVCVYACMCVGVCACVWRERFIHHSNAADKENHDSWAYNFEMRFMASLVILLLLNSMKKFLMRALGRVLAWVFPLPL